MNHFDVDEPIKDPIVQNNYKIVGNYLMDMVDQGLDFLKQVYIERNSDTSFQEFAAENYYDYLLRDYLRRKIKTQIRFILKATAYSLLCNDNTEINSVFLDDFIKDIFPSYEEIDLVLLHSDANHPSYSELVFLSRLTLRVAILQLFPILKPSNSSAESIIDLILSAYPNEKDSNNSIDAIFSMFDQIIDVFERNLELINIPFYRPTWRIRDFTYTRRLYEYALKRVRHEISSIYQGGANHET